MTTMSYCAIENTRSDLAICYGVLSALINDEESINEYEQRNLPGFISLCRELVEMYDYAVEQGTIDEKGRLEFEREEIDA